jgi:hypothetical protein
VRVLEPTSPLRPLGTSALDRHRFDANPDSTFHFDPDPDSTTSFTHVEQSGKNVGYDSHSAMNLFLSDSEVP